MHIPHLNKYILILFLAGILSHQRALNEAVTKVKFFLMYFYNYCNSIQNCKHFSFSLLFLASGESRTGEKIYL